MDVACHVGFGTADLRAARRRGDVLVIVDVLSFSTAVCTGAARGVVFLPAGSRRRAQALAVEHEAALAVSRNEGSAAGRYSLSPLSYAEAPPGLRVALRSPNGARMLHLAAGAPAVLVGALVNGSAAGAAATTAAEEAGSGVTVLACGERERLPGRGRRFAAEDLLGAGAVALAVRLPRTGEASVAVDAFRAALPRLERVLLATESGRELAAAGWREDVLHAARHDLLTTVPRLDGGMLRGT